jgi:hypothetical protein
VDGVFVATADILTQLRSTLLPRTDEVPRTPGRVPSPRRAAERASGADSTVDPASGPPPGWVPRTTRPPRPAHEPGC